MGYRDGKPREYEAMLSTHRQFDDEADQEGIEEAEDEEEYYERPTNQKTEEFKRGGRDR